jgi:asparagine synthase (glutamine-hydrolysing)
MCGICIVWGKKIDMKAFQKALDALGPRGPDITQHELFVHDQTGTEVAVGFARLHIQGSSKPEQPFQYGKRILVCNGEIFNSDFLIQKLGLQVPEGGSDCAVLPALLEQKQMNFVQMSRQLDGDFAIVELDLESGSIRVSRDPYGVRPLYYAKGDTWYAIASELKGLPADATFIEMILPGRCYQFSLDSDDKSSEVWHQPPWLKTPYWRSSLDALTEGGAAIRHALEEAVYKRLSTVREIGACLSGGLDSSLVAAIAAKRLAASGRVLNTYSIGMEGSPDLLFARKVAEHIGSKHHERIVSAEECLAIIPTVIHAIESFDITTVRASVGNYLVADLVAKKTLNVKVVLNGDGADEVLGGYLYMRAAPDDASFESETDRLLEEIHMYDVLRSERSMAAHGLESRSPFLDRQFVSIARSLPTDALRPSSTMMEKTFLRAAFAESGLLPDEVLWRRKEAFSDGISRAERSWFEMAKEEGEKRATLNANKYTINPPKTAEAFWYRELFHEHYPQIAAIVAPAMWMPRFVAATDPSARTLSLYTV